MTAVCLAIPKESPRADEAWRFAVFCADTKGQEAAGDALVGAVPAKTAAAALPAFNPSRPTAYAALTQAAYKSKATPLSWAAAYLEREAWPDQVRKLLAGQQDVPQTVAALQAAGEAALKTDLAKAAEAATRERR